MVIKLSVGSDAESRRTLYRQLFKFLTFSVVLLPCLAMAQAVGGGNATSAVCGVLGTVQNLLNVVSVVVVTIAIVFSGYQISFAHKRIAEVAPIMIGGVLIGAAGQIAKMILGNTLATKGGTCTTMVVHLLQHYV